MGVYLNPGNEQFAASVNSELYIDKTELIAYTNSRMGKDRPLICSSRPRRFGKTMAITMLAAYYSKGCRSEKLFADLKNYSGAFLKLAYITGILPIKKYGTQSALNNFREHTMVSPSHMAEYIGFTELEVKTLCKK